MTSCTTSCERLLETQLVLRSQALDLRSQISNPITFKVHPFEFRAERRRDGTSEASEADRQLSTGLEISSHRDSTLRKSTAGSFESRAENEESVYGLLDLNKDSLCKSDIKRGDFSSSFFPRSDICLNSSSNGSPLSLLLTHWSLPGFPSLTSTRSCKACSKSFSSQSSRHLL